MKTPNTGSHKTAKTFKGLSHQNRNQGEVSKIQYTASHKTAKTSKGVLPRNRKQGEGTKRPYTVSLKTAKTFKGVLHALKVFPPSKPGREHFPSWPQSLPSSLDDFDTWIDYFVGLFGHYLPVLNGLQFDLDLDPNLKLKFEKEFEDFAAYLGIGDSKTIPHPSPAKGNPAQLIWPLSGIYYFAYTDGPGGLGLTVIASFELDPVYDVVTNCAMQLTACLTPDARMAKGVPLFAMKAGGGRGPVLGTMDYISSSSSYLAASSSPT
jgi:hypothetical protein